MKPTTFWILITPAGHVVGSAYPQALDILVEDMPDDYDVKKVSGDEWDRWARPCLSGKCEHAGPGGAS